MARLAQTAPGISPLFQQDRIGRLRPVAVGRQAFGKAWDGALVDWLATHLPSVVLHEGYDPGAGGDPPMPSGPSTAGTRCEEKGS